MTARRRRVACLHGNWLKSSLEASDPDRAAERRGCRGTAAIIGRAPRSRLASATAESWLRVRNISAVMSRVPTTQPGRLSMATRRPAASTLGVLVVALGSSGRSGSRSTALQTAVGIAPWRDSAAPRRWTRLATRPPARTGARAAGNSQPASTADTLGPRPGVLARIRGRGPSWLDRMTSATIGP